MGRSLQDEFALLPEDVREAWLAEQPKEVLDDILAQQWWWVARPEQVPPETGYIIFLYLAGRGTGKTRSGSEWIVDRCLTYPTDRSGIATEHLVVAESLSEARKICVEGASGILNVLRRRGFEDGKDFIYTRSPKPKITFTAHGTKIYFEGADNEDCGRGGNNTSMWLDEVCTWRNAERVWLEGLMPSLRADIDGDHPRCFVTTTPKPIPLLREWLATTNGTVEKSRGSTFDNAANLSAAMLEEMRRRYEGTALGRQELYGEMLDDLEGVLFSGTHINNNRVDIGPEDVAFRVLAVDPSLTGDDESDEMGVVVASRSRDDHMYIVADESVRLTGRDAAIHCWRVFEQYECDMLVVETTLAKGWMAQVLTDAYRELQRDGFFPDHTNPPMMQCDPSFRQGKVLRAEPVAMRYEQGRVHHIGVFQQLEDQMTGWNPAIAKDSPDRLDALVYACRYLMQGEKKKARIIMPSDYALPSRTGADLTFRPFGVTPTGGGGNRVNGSRSRRV
jgi:phage terminase large subunit-like protein